MIGGHVEQRRIRLSKLGPGKRIQGGAEDAKHIPVAGP